MLGYIPEPQVSLLPISWENCEGKTTDEAVCPRLLGHASLRLPAENYPKGTECNIYIRSRHVTAVAVVVGDGNARRWAVYGASRGDIVAVLPWLFLQARDFRLSGNLKRLGRWEVRRPKKGARFKLEKVRQ